jgi:hypothetical protein
VLALVLLWGGRGVKPTRLQIVLVGLQKKGSGFIL